MKLKSKDKYYTTRVLPMADYGSNNKFCHVNSIAMMENMSDIIGFVIYGS